MPKKIGLWTQLSSVTKYKNKWLSVREDKVVRPDGKKGVYGVIESPAPAVFVVPVNAQKEILLIKTFRYPLRRWSWEIPAGNSDGQPPLVAAKRELLEETGYKTRKWTRLGKMDSMNGISDEEFIVYLAEELIEGESTGTKEEGIADQKWVRTTELAEMIAKGKFTDGQSISSLFIAFYKLGLIE